MGSLKPAVKSHPSQKKSLGCVHVLTALFLSAALAFFHLGTGLASSNTWTVTQPQVGMPRLADFIGSVRNDRANVLVGVYAPGVLALPIVPQPAENPAYVSSQYGQVTQFSLAWEFGSIGLLAHNTHSGAEFFQLKVGQEVILVYGDGRTSHFRVREMASFQALSPRSPYSNFIDLTSGATMNAADLFLKVYAQPGKLVFQTCIEANGITSWGRLFIIAEPFQPVVEMPIFEFSSWRFPE
jgi:hypothetical protein